MPPDMTAQTPPSAPAQWLTQSHNLSQLPSTPNASVDKGQERAAPEPRRSNPNEPVHPTVRVRSNSSLQRNQRTSSSNNHCGQPLSTADTDLTQGTDMPSIFPALPISSPLTSSAPRPGNLLAASGLVPNTHAPRGCPSGQQPPNNHERLLGFASPPLLPLFLDEASRPPFLDVLMLPPPPLVDAGTNPFLPPFPVPTLPLPPQVSTPPLLAIGTFSMVIGDQALATLVNSQATAPSNLRRAPTTSTGQVTYFTMAQPSDGFVSAAMPITTIETDIPLLSSQGRQGLANNNTGASTQNHNPACTCNIGQEVLTAGCPPEQQQSSSMSSQTRSHTSLPQFPLLIDDSGIPPLLDAIIRPRTAFQGTAPQFLLPPFQPPSFIRPHTDFQGTAPQFLPPPFQPPSFPQPVQQTLRALDVGSILLVIGDQPLATMVNRRSSASPNPPREGTTQSGPTRNYFPHGLAMVHRQPSTITHDAAAASTSPIAPVTTIEIDIPLFSTDSLPVLADDNTAATLHTSNSPSIAPQLPAIEDWPSTEAAAAEIVRDSGQRYDSDGTLDTTASSLAPPNRNATPQNNTFAIVPLQAVTTTAPTAEFSPLPQGVVTPNTGSTAPFVLLEDQSVPAVTTGNQASQPTRYRFAVNIGHFSPSTTPIVRLEAEPQNSPPGPVVPRPAVRSRTHVHSTQRQL
ncbi:hypothetical protein HPB48_012808 [Haemaphysalis longicornis]|uniref:Uncharacterized protein n=1 Tax=Haemaphysalis longicornis TaxID=44386 RepID=A0A9J6FC01_HAELO|nr:hypothetical protein HPB48_012808 [Haemaphysalis longicornis]